MLTFQCAEYTYIQHKGTLIVSSQTIKKLVVVVVVVVNRYSAL